MKTRFTILGLFLAVLLLLLWLSRHGQPVLTQTLGPKTNAVASVAKSLTKVPSTAVPTNTGIPTPEEFAKMKPELERRRQELREKALDEWRTPIEFYGRVVDESNNAVAYANVDFGCNDISATGTSFYHTTSDANGGFSITGIQGKLLQVTVGKEGYYSYDRFGQDFYYAGQNQNFVPDAGNPVVFRLRKKGKSEPLIATEYPGFAHIAQLKHDGTPVELNLLNGTQVPVGSGQLHLQFWRDLSGRNAKVFDWKLQIVVPGGGLIETNEQFAFVAPEGGYQSAVIIDESTNDPEWKGSLKDKYYLRLPDGKYGRIDFELLPYNGVFNVHSVINPTGSRNLEPAQ